MTASEFLKERNRKIVERYKELKTEKISHAEAKKIISDEFNNISVSTIEQIIYNRKYSNSPHQK